MKCYLCGEGALVQTRETLPYRSLPGVMLEGIKVETCPECGERFESIPAIAGLDRRLVEALVSKSTRLTPEEIRFLRKSVGWSAQDFARHMRVDPATVSRWESGKQAPAAQSDLLIRFLIASRTPVERFEDEHVGLGAPQRLDRHFVHGEDWELAESA